MNEPKQEVKVSDPEEVAFREWVDSTRDGWPTYISLWKAACKWQREVLDYRPDEWKRGKRNEL